jgi:hypothetical protein
MLPRIQGTHKLIEFFVNFLLFIQQYFLGGTFRGRRPSSDASHVDHAAAARHL